MSTSLIAPCLRSEPDPSPRERPDESPEGVEPAKSDCTFVRSPRDLRRLTADVARHARDYPIIGLALDDGEVEPVIAPRDVCALTEAGTRIYVIVGDHLLRRLRKAPGTTLSVGGSSVWIWWPTRRCRDVADHRAGPDSPLEQFARQLELSRPIVRGEVGCLERSKAALEQQLAKERERSTGFERRLRDAVYEEGDTANRLVRAEQELTDALRTLQALREAGLDEEELQMIARMGPEDRLHRLIFREWMRLTPADRRAHPLSYVFGPRFLDTVQEHPEIPSARLVRVCAAIASRRKQVGLTVDPLRRGAGPTAEQLVRADGAKAWRARVSTNASSAPSAARLHFWIHPGGRVEFASVGAHDDFSTPDA